MLFLYFSRAAGAGAGYYIRQTMMAKQTENAENKAQELLKKTRSEAQDIVLSSKKDAQRVIDEARKE